MEDLSAPRTRTRQLAESEKSAKVEALDLELAPMQRPPSAGTLHAASKLIIRFGADADDMTVELLPR